MRIFLLPISTRRTLLYCSRSAPTSAAKPSLQDRIVAKANTTWTDWERSPTQWKQTLTTYGNKLFSRLPYDEWALKTLPPLSAGSAEAATQPVPVLHPSLLRAEDVTPALRRLAHEDRQVLHRRRMWGSLALMPLTIPVGLIPVLPNVPFFYLAFRAWSHYRALYGARYLALLLDKGLLAARPSAELDRVYGPAPGGEGEMVLLTRDKGKEVAEKLGLPGVQVEIERAVDQVKAALEKERLEREGKEKQQ